MNTGDEKRTDSQRPGRALHPIGVVARRTGLSTHALRAWEQRYGAVTPERTTGGQRLYSEGDIARLRLLRRATELGHSIGRVARLSSEGIAILLHEEATALDPWAQGASATPGIQSSGHAARALSDAFAAAHDLDASRLHAVLMRAVVQVDPDQFVEDVALPLMQRVGAWWAEGRLRPAEEHVVSVVVRRVLAWLMEQVTPTDEAPVVVLTTLQGERHELGAMLAGVLAAVDGWRPVYLGPDLPPEEITGAARTTAAAAVAISMILVGGAEALRQIEAVRGDLEPEVALIVGGPAAAGITAALRSHGVTQLDDLGAYRQALRALVAGAADGAGRSS